MNPESKPPQISRQFHLKTHPGIEKILIFSDGKFIEKMKRIDVGDSTGVYFNGKLLTDKKTTVCLLSEQKRAYYTFNELFSEPLTTNHQKSEWNNTIIVNTPKDIIKFVEVKFPDIWRKFCGVPKNIFLYRVPFDKIRLPEDMKGTNSDYLNLGIDPQGDSYIGTVGMKIAEGYMQSLNDGDISLIMKNKILVKCYMFMKKQSFSGDDFEKIE